MSNKKENKKKRSNQKTAGHNLARTSGYRVMSESYPSGRGRYSGMDIDADFIESNKRTVLVGEYDTKEEAIQVAKDRRRQACQFDDWATDHYKTTPPPYRSSDAPTPVKVQDEDVHIFIEDIAAQTAEREAALAEAKSSTPPKKKKAMRRTYKKGTIITKFFDSVPFKGEITSYDSKEEFYKIRYEDGDQEELEENEMLPCLVGALVSKFFDGVPFNGEVLAYDSEAELFNIRYEDGDKDEVENEELKDIILVDPKEVKKARKKLEDGPTAPPAVASAAQTKPKARTFGFVEGDFDPDENRFVRHPCRIEGGEQHMPNEYGKSFGDDRRSSFSYLVQRISDRNYSMRGLCIDGDGAKYSLFRKMQVGMKCVAFLPETDLNHHSKDDKIVDACHLDLVHPITGKCFLTSENLLTAVTPETECLFLNGYEVRVPNDDIDPNAIVKAILACKDNLQCFALTECVVSKEIVAALASCKKLKGITFYMTQNHEDSPATDDDLASIVENCHDLRWLYIDERSGMFDDATWTALANAKCCPNIEVLWVDSVENTSERRCVALGDHDTIRKALNQRSSMIKLCMINPDIDMKSRFVIGDKAADRLQGEEYPDDDFLGDPHVIPDLNDPPVVPGPDWNGPHVDPDCDGPHVDSDNHYSTENDENVPEDANFWA